MAYAAQKGLHIHQMDVINVFVQGSFAHGSQVYVKYPPGMKKIGKCLQLLRPLYGVQQSAKLWYETAAKSLRDINFQPLPEEECIFKSGDILLLYVDDILLLGPDISISQEVKQQIQERFQVRDMGEAEYFLGIKIIRNREQRKLWLVQDSYINKVVSRFHLEHAPMAYCPLTTTSPIKPFSGQASAENIHLYQQKVGSVLYSSVISRPDIAFAASRLRQYLTNPGPEHFTEINHLICYLRDTKYLGIEYDGTVTNYTAMSNAAYADQSDLKSTAAYVFTYGCGPVDWRSYKQRNITLSTTEAELVSITLAAKELQW